MEQASPAVDYRLFFPLMLKNNINTREIMAFAQIRRGETWSCLDIISANYVNRIATWMR